jgi:hypothetical protein
MTRTDWATLGSSIAAAIAAIAAWAAVIQSSRWQRRQRAPELNIQVSEILGSNVEIRVRIENSGGGFARQAYFWVREGPAVCASGVPPHGSLGAGQGVTVRPHMSRVGQPYVEAVVWCHFGRRIHAWDAGGRHKSWILNALWRKISRINDEGIVRRFYRDAPPVERWNLRSFTFEN